MQKPPKTRIVTKGKLSHIVSSLFSLMMIGFIVNLKRLFGIYVNKKWSTDTEIGIIFWRGQFNRAFRFKNIATGRHYFDSLQTYYGYEPKINEKTLIYEGGKARLLVPGNVKSDVKILYFHGGGYSFYAEVTKHFTKMLSEYLGIDFIVPDYPLTPENPHPKQLECAIASYKYLLESGYMPSKLVLAGDSAGGHLALMLLSEIKKQNLAMPALVIGLCAWTHTGEYGDSLYENDKYDLVQGYMAVRFGKWLKNEKYDDRQISPMFQDYSKCAPIYLQGGSREVLIDMIRDFAVKNEKEGVKIALDIFDEMTHEFQANGTYLPESALALERIAEAINCFTDDEYNNQKFRKLEISKVFTF